jgi:predicted small metal-binding protein
MARLIKCDCGYIVRGDTDEELVAAGQAHIREAHPDMVGQVSDEQLVAMAEED